MASQPCFKKFRLGYCPNEKSTCNFSHDKCVNGDSCPYRFCGYHLPSNNHTLLHYFKFWDVEKRFKAGAPVDHFAIYNEIISFIIILWDIRKAYYGCVNQYEFEQVLKSMLSIIESDHKMMQAVGSPIRYTNPHVLVAHVLQMISQHPDLDQFMEEFLTGACYEIGIAQEFVNWISGIAYEFVWVSEDDIRQYCDSGSITSSEWADSESEVEIELESEEYEEAFPSLMA